MLGVRDAVRLASAVRSLALVAVLTAACSGQSTEPLPPPAGQTPQGEPRAREPQRFALLVGVTRWANPSMPVKPLEGPENDVKLFTAVLRERLGVPAENISVLAGLPTDERLQPRRANIQRELDRLSALAIKGDQFVLLMAGHGSQQPANAEAGDDEPDGLDEIFLPADAGLWDGTTGSVTNVVVDDDIRGWVAKIREAGASAWLLFDSCHSGTMMRGAPTMRERQVSMDELRIPATAIAAARRGSRTASATRKTVLGLADTETHVAAMYAADMSEKTIEGLFGSDLDVRGLFSSTVIDVLASAPGAMTYRQLASRVLDTYRGRQRFASTPMFEGGALDQQILGLEKWPERPPFRLAGPSPAGGWLLEAGSIHGLTPGAILELYPPSGTLDATRPVGHIRVVALQTTSARVEPMAFEKTAAPHASSLASGSLAKVKFHSIGDLALRVALQLPSTTGSTPPEFVTAPAGGGPPEMERALSSLAGGTNGLARRVDTPDADWYVRVQDQEVVLVPAAGWQPDAAPYTRCDAKEPWKRAASEPAPDVPGARRLRAALLSDRDLGERLSSSFRRISAAANVARLETQVGTPLRVDVAVMRRTGREAQPIRSSGVAILEDDEVEFLITNRDQKTIDIGLVYIDAAFGITLLFPSNDERDNRLKPGAVKRHKFSVTGCPLGWEATIVLAVEAQRTPEDFSALSQERIERGSAAATSPMRAILDAAARGQGARRSGQAPSTRIDQFFAKLVSWRTDAKPANRPQPR
jgi:hypothetical protein